jgi:predicted alpha/beta-hydrolase family hydrolase
MTTMTTGPEQLSISLDDGSSVTGLLYSPSRAARSGVTLILGHGAGAGQLHPFMQLFASGLAERGIDALTFNFQYMEQGRRVPDPKAKLEACYCSVIEAARKHKKLKGNRLVIVGKSMGGRIASQVAALDCGGSTPLSDAAAHSSQESKTHRKTKKQSNSEAARANESNVVQTPANDIAGLVFLGYPLHPPGKPDQPRDAHLPQITAPTLFVQGSRDAFGSAEEIRATLKKHHPPATLHIVEGGDHSLKVPKSGGASGASQDQIYVSVLDGIAAWLQAK